jgi:hypothetical protein
MRPNPAEARRKRRWQVETSNVKRASGSPQARCEFEDATSEVPARDEASTATLVAMLACDAILLLMLSA